MAHTLIIHKDRNATIHCPANPDYDIMVRFRDSEHYASGSTGRSGLEWRCHRTLGSALKRAKVIGAVGYQTYVIDSDGYEVSDDAMRSHGWRGERIATRDFGPIMDEVLSRG